MTIQEFIDTNDNADSYEYKIVWNGYKVYEIFNKDDDGKCTGYPRYALDNGKIIRLATFPEIKKIMSAINK